MQTTERATDTASMVGDFDEDNAGCGYARIARLTGQLHEMRARLLERDFPAHVSRQLQRSKHVKLHGKHGRKARASGNREITRPEVVKVDVKRQEGQGRSAREEDYAPLRPHEDEREVLPQHHHAVQPHLQLYKERQGK